MMNLFPPPLFPLFPMPDATEVHRQAEHILRDVQPMLCTEPADRRRVEEALHFIYWAAGERVPPVRWVDNPIQMMRYHSNRYAMDKDRYWRERLVDMPLLAFKQSVKSRYPKIIHDQIMQLVYPPIQRLDRIVNHMMSDVMLLAKRANAWGSDKRGVVYSITPDVAIYRNLLTPSTHDPLLESLMTICHHAGGWIPMNNAVLVSERPLAYHLDTQQRLHCEDGPAVVWRGQDESKGLNQDSGLYALHGVRVQASWVLEPESLTAKVIRDLMNLEVRRVLIDRMGRERFIRESEVYAIDADETYGTLYRTGWGEVWLEVTNRTAEPDGTFKKYFLSIDGSAYAGDATRVAQAAAASTWRYPNKALVFENWRDYRPIRES